jgi:hypothetical protein
MTGNNDWLLLSDSLEQIRKLTNDAKSNTMMQDKKYMELAQRMTEISRQANICAGIYFSLWMKAQAPSEKEDPPLVTLTPTEITPDDNTT